MSAIFLALIACGDGGGGSSPIDSGPGTTADADVGAADASQLPVDAVIGDADHADAAADAAPVDAAPPQTFYWADWTTATTGGAGGAAGTFDPPSGPVTISYSGEVSFAQTSGGTNYWVPGDPYVNAVTANAPGHSDIIALTGNADTKTISFDPPVHGVVMALVSLGTPGTNVKYAFDNPITLLSFGAGYWGNGTIVVEGDSTISGSEGHGAVQFLGTVSSISWTVMGSEYWHGFTLGIPNQQ